MNKLFIIGNGFDIYHGVSSKYSDFRNFLNEKDKKLCDLAETYFDSTFLWSDFEECLAGIDTDLLLENASEFLMPYGIDNWKDSYNHSYQSEIDDIVECLSTRLKDEFTKWVLQIEIPTISCTNDKYLKYIDAKELFLIFNYTNTLQDLYSVSEENILHIHNKAEDEYSDLILGHSWKPIDKYVLSKDIETFDDEYSECDIDFRIQEGNRIIKTYFQRTYKPTLKIIENNESFFNTLNFIKEIYVLGHSISDVDIPYFDKIIKSINSETRWKISYYGEEEFVRHRETMQKLGINENLITFSTIDDL
jgi:hypothetical protein